MTAPPAPTTTPQLWRVLIIDDSLDDRAEVRRLLLRGSERRYELAEAETGAAGVRAVFDADDPPDCVVLDYNLPDMDAVEVLAALASPPGLTACPVVVLTGTVGQEETRAVLRAGAQDYLGKSWMTPESMTRAVENAAERWAMARELSDQAAALCETNQKLQMSMSIGRIISFTWDIPTNEVRRPQVFDSFLDATTRRPDTFEEVLAKVHPDDRNDFERRVWQAIERPARQYKNAYRMVGPDGSVRWFSDIGRVEFSDDGKPLRLVGLATDITHRKQAEEARRLTNERLALAVKCSQVALFQQDLELRYTWLQNAVPGFADAHVIGRRDADVMERAADAAVVEALKREVIRSGVSQRQEVLVQIQGVGRHYELLVEPQRDAAGQISGVTGAAIDITERVRAEEARHESERNYRALAAASSEIAYRMSADWSTMLLLDGRQLVASSDQSLEDWAWLNKNIPLDEHPRVRKAISEAIARKSHLEMEHRVRRPDGLIGWTFSRAVPILDENEEVIAWFGAASDITARKQAEEKLRRLAAELSEADRRKDVFLATLAHELRNPLAPLRSGLHVMRLAGVTGQVEQVRAIMERQVTQLVRLVDDLLDVSRVTSGKLELRKERVDLRAVVEAALETSRTVIEQGGHELAVVVPDEPILVDGDATRLAQVVSNLLNNSAKYTPRGGHIRLTAGHVGKMAMVSVKDDGMGIPPAMLGRVFEMFTQVDRALEKTTGGLGIGLSLVKGLMEMHGGTIEAKSDGEGLGSEFVVRLPALMSVVAKPDRPSGQANEVVPPARRRILVVDDNVDSSDMLARFLELLGNEVRTAHDGEAGIGVAAQFRPDVVLMDIGMPKLNGYDAAIRIREQTWGKSVVLVALTGWGQDEDKRKSKEAGFDAHLVKPVDPAALDTLLGGFDSKAGRGASSVPPLR